MLVGAVVGLCLWLVGFPYERMSVCALAVWELALAVGHAAGCVRWDMRWLGGLLVVAYASDTVL